MTNEKKFKASNGIEIEKADGIELLVYDKQGILYTNITEPLGDALCEYFQYERDQKLGRVRWPENPDYVIYRDEQYDDEEGRYVRVLHEPRAVALTAWDKWPAEPRITSDFAARWYFTEGPGKQERPWEQAEAGEVWRLTHYGEEQNAVAEKDSSSGRVRFNTHDNYISAEDRGVTAGRKLLEADGRVTKGEQE